MFLLIERKYCAAGRIYFAPGMLKETKKNCRKFLSNSSESHSEAAYLPTLPIPEEGVGAVMEG